MTVIKVDLSALSGGLLRTTQRRADRPVRIGERVLAFDPAEGHGYPARVMRTTPEGRVYLDANFEESDQ